MGQERSLVGHQTKLELTPKYEHNAHDTYTCIYLFSQYIMGNKGVQITQTC